MEQKVNKTDRLAFINVNMSRLTNVSRTSKTHCTFLLNVYPNKVPPILSHRPDSISKFSPFLLMCTFFFFQVKHFVCKREEKLFNMTCPVQCDAFNINRRKHGRYVGIFQMIAVLLSLLEGLHLCN